MRPLSLARFAALAFLCFAVPLAWSQQIGSIVGEVRVARGDFPEPVLVNLQIRGASMASAYTDSDGRFFFPALYANVYHVVINDDRYQPVDISAELRPDIQPMLIMQVLLVPRPGRSPSPAGPSVVSAIDFTHYPKNAVKEFQRGAKNESEGKTQEAIDHYRKAIKQAPNFAMAHNNLGALYVGQSKFAEAQAELTTSIRLAPSDSRAYFNLANLMLLNGKLQEAEQNLQQGFRLQPESAFGLFVQGSVMERAGKLPDAERALRRALELNPKMTRTHLELVNLYLRQKRSADAIAQLQKFLKDAPTDPLAPQARGVLQKLQGASPPSRQ